MHNFIHGASNFNANAFNFKEVKQMQEREQLRLSQERVKKEFTEEQTKMLIELIKKETNVNAIRNQAIKEFATRLKKLTMITEYDIDMLVEEMCGKALDWSDGERKENES